jgi:hypothetical protein
MPLAEGHWNRTGIALHNCIRSLPTNGMRGPHPAPVEVKGPSPPSIRGEGPFTPNARTRWSHSGLNRNF